jgi:hypothetical protein
MGKRKPKQFVIFFLSFGLTVLFSCCVTHKDTSWRAVELTGISWTENTIEISFLRVTEPDRELKEFFYVEYKNFPGSVYLHTKIVEEPHETGYGYKGTMIVDLTDVPIAVLADVERFYNDLGRLIYKPSLVINEEARLRFEEKGISTGGLLVEVFIGENRIDILSQRYYIHRFRY